MSREIVMLFARSKTTYQMWNFYGEFCEAWVFGTIDEYAEFAAVLDRHATGEEVHTVIPAAKDSPGMDVLLLPTCTDASRAFLVVHERVICRNASPNMELIVGGTSEGFAYLRDQFLEAIEAGAGDPSWHVHVSTSDTILQCPAVFLNIRGPVQAWSEKDLDPYWKDCVLPGGPHRMPKLPYSPSRRLNRYSLLSYDDLFGRLPRIEREERNDEAEL